MLVSMDTRPLCLQRHQSQPRAHGASTAGKDIVREFEGRPTAIEEADGTPQPQPSSPTAKPSTTGLPKEMEVIHHLFQAHMGVARGEEANNGVSVEVT